MSNFVIFSTQRTGSTLLVTLLDSHPEILCIGEALKDNSSPIAHAEFSFYNYRTSLFKERRLNYIYSFLNRRESLLGKMLIQLLRAKIVKRYLDYIYSLPGYNIIGFKLHYLQFKRFPTVINYFRSNNVKIIHLVRSNTLKKYLSLIKAKTTGVYTTAKKLQSEKIFIPPDKLFRELEKLSEEDKQLESNISSLPYIKVEYEQLVDKKKETTLGLLRYLNVDESVELTTTLKKINPDRIEDIVENYGEISTLLEGSQYEWCLD